MDKLQEIVFMTCGTQATDVVRSMAQSGIENTMQIPKGNEKDLALIGITVIGPLHNDNILVNAILPHGWTKKRTDHGMYTNILDEKGRVRASCMYKAEFYDRDGRTSVVRRFSASYINDSWLDPEAEDNDFPVIKDSNDTVVWRGHPIKKANEWRDGHDVEWRGDHYDSEKNRHYYSSSDHARAIAEEMLAKYCPLYFEDTNKHHTLYWDTEIEWPESLSQAPQGDLYNVHVALYRIDNYGGYQHVDSGNHASFVATDLESAKRKLKLVINKSSVYDKSVYTVTLDGKTVIKEEKRKPQPKSKKTCFFSNDDMYGRYGDFYNGR